MSIKRYTSDSDNTISTAFKFNLSDRASKSNMGSSDVLELFSVFGQASSSSIEKSRVLINFPIVEIYEDRAKDIIGESGSVSFKLKLGNASHGQTTPEKYYISVHPITREWSEGHGLDMESYLDVGPSNWNSASLNNEWHTYGGDYVNPDVVIYDVCPLEYSQHIEQGHSDIEVDITPLVEEWFKGPDCANTATKATASLQINNLQNSELSGTLLKIDSHSAQRRIFTFTNEHQIEVSSSGETVYVPTGSNSANSTANLSSSIDLFLSGGVEVKIVGSVLEMTQSSPGFYGNTAISASDSSIYTSIDEGFSGGTGAQNYGLLVKLSGSYEDGSQSRSFYTKKLYSRSSHHFFKRPTIEAQWDDSIKDERYSFHKAQRYYSEEVSNNNIYFYNKVQGRLADFPSNINPMVVRLYETLGSSPSTLRNGATTATIGRAKTGVYSASFGYDGNASSLYDVWEIGESRPSASVAFSVGHSPDYSETAGAYIEWLSPRVWDGNEFSAPDPRAASVLTTKYPFLAISSSNLAIFALDAATEAVSTWNAADKVYTISVVDITASALTPGWEDWYPEHTAFHPAVILPNIYWRTFLTRLVAGINTRTADTYIKASIVEESALSTPVGGGKIEITRTAGYDPAVIPKIAFLNHDNIGSFWHNNSSLYITSSDAPNDSFDVVIGNGNYIVQHQNISVIEQPFNLHHSFEAPLQTKFYITGSGITVIDTAEHNSYSIPEYVVNIVNLKPTYNQAERTTLKVYTRNKNWQPNIYTVASSDAPVDNIRDMFYRVTRVADNLEVISYSTGSAPHYSQVSYDKEGSFFDLDMSLFETNYQYEISFLYKDGPDYVEQKEKFRFRVE